MKRAKKAALLAELARLRAENTRLALAPPSECGWPTPLRGS